MLKINGIELEEIDLMDADEAARIEEATVKVQEDCKEAEKIKIYSELIRFQCDSIYECFDTIFGESTGEELFEGKKNLRVCINAYQELMTYINAKQTEIEKEYAKYTPNRAARRSK